MSRRISRSLSILASASLLCAAVVGVSAQAASADPAPLTVTDMTNGATADALAHTLAGPGVSISNVTYVGAPNAAGTFTGGDSAFGFGSGVVLSTGSVQTDAAHPGPCAKGVEGPNQCESNTTQNGTPGDVDLNAMAGFPTFDAAVLQFDFIPAGSTSTFRYVFGSDEYPEYANSVYNDMFAFLVNGTNCALVPGSTQTVSINTINGGNPLGYSARNSQYYIDNHYDPVSGSPRNTELDGLTTVLTCTADTVAGQVNHMKLAIADGSDAQLDSDVMLQAASLTSQPDPVQVTSTLSAGDQTGPNIVVPSGTPVTDQATLSGSTVSNAGGTVTYTAYTDSSCASPPHDAGTMPVVHGVVAHSNPLVLTGGTYFWQATYSGDSTHATTASTCGGDGVLTVTAAANSRPNGSTGGPYSGAEGTPLYVTASASDPDNDPLTTTWTATPLSGTDAGAACTFADAHALATTVTCNDDGVFTLGLTISDGVNAAIALGTTLSVSNVAPTVTIASPQNGSTSDVGAPVTVKATFTDPGSNDSQVCSIDWGNGTTSNGFVSAHTCTGTYGYPVAGTYTATVTVTDDDAGVGSASVTLVAADSTGKVTGGGFENAGGRTTFGFVVKAMPSGGLSGQFEMNGRGNLQFHGSTVTSLTTTTTSASWTGGGEWMGVPGYTFSVSVVDNGQGGGTGNTPDALAITIRNATGGVVFSMSGALYGGNLVIH